MPELNPKIWKQVIKRCVKAGMSEAGAWGILEASKFRTWEEYTKVITHITGVR